MYQQLPTKNKVHYLNPAKDSFEQAYIAVREKEGRVLTDEVVMFLPHLPLQHPRRNEWQKRNFTVRKAIPIIAASSPKQILDLGCGNGWFTNILAQATNATVIGADVNVTELEQAARLFEGSNCHFIYGDIFLEQWPTNYFDIITLNACVQYFPDLDLLLAQLLKRLTSNGTIHLLDSPFYDNNKIEAAKHRTTAYYQQQGVPEMISFYHHQAWAVLQKYNTKVLYQPSSFLNKMKGKFNRNISPFPWVVVKAY